MIERISYEECLELWLKMWSTRKTEITPMSAMDLPKDNFNRKIYFEYYAEPIFLGYRLDGKIVGVNSIHSINGKTRSRGLYVEPEYRKHKIGQSLLEESISIGLQKTDVVWSFPKKEALNTYLRAGFTQLSPLIYDELEDKWNCYVKIQS